MNYLKKILLLLISLGWLINPILTVKAAEFNPSYIISDSELLDYNSMDLGEIQRFLDSKPGTLNDFLTFDKDGLMKNPSEIIYQLAQKYRINPKYILTLLQKEQSLIDDPYPSQDQYDWATGYAICDACDKTDPALQ